MEPPSTSPPVALRWGPVERAFRDADPEEVMALAERAAREARLDPPASDAPMTLRGAALERALAHLQH